ncbi:MAG: hypothetical protein ABL985_13395 [Casimicrobium sp.]
MRTADGDQLEGQFAQQRVIANLEYSIKVFPRKSDLRPCDSGKVAHQYIRRRWIERRRPMAYPMLSSVVTSCPKDAGTRKAYAAISVASPAS